MCIRDRSNGDIINAIVMEVGNMEKSNDVNLSEVSNFMTLDPMHLNVLPKKQNKKIAVLNMIATLFDENKKYSEVEVNDCLLYTSRCV